MQLLKSIGALSLMFSMTLFILSCGGNAAEGNGGEEAATTEVAHGEGKEYTSAYVCPMHCEGSGSDEVGTCPVCGMDYVAQEAHTEDGHMHE